jgi:hypothetical protein
VDLFHILFIYLFAGQDLWRSLLLESKTSLISSVTNNTQTSFFGLKTFIFHYALVGPVLLAQVTHANTILAEVGLTSEFL